MKHQRLSGKDVSLEALEAFLRDTPACPMCHGEGLSLVNGELDLCPQCGGTGLKEDEDE